MSIYTYTATMKYYFIKKELMENLPTTGPFYLFYCSNAVLTCFRITEIW